MLCTGHHPVSHSLSWTNHRSQVTNGVAHTKLWTPEDLHSAKANGYYPAEGWGTIGSYEWLLGINSKCDFEVYVFYLKYTYTWPQMTAGKFSAHDDGGPCSYDYASHSLVQPSKCPQICAAFGFDKMWNPDVSEGLTNPFYPSKKTISLLKIP